jgi:hypothetical protein
MSLTRRFTTRFALLLVLPILLAAAMASTASAATWDGRLDTMDGSRWVSHTLYDVGSVWNGVKVNGAALDVAANDARCTRVYTAGYNYVLGWTGWSLQGTACAGGSTTWSNTYTVYADHIRVALCAGTIGNLCTSRQVW